MWARRSLDPAGPQVKGVSKNEWFGRPIEQTLRLHGLGWAWAIAAAIGAPWYLVVAARHPGLAGYLLGNQVWQRMTTHVHHRGGGWWYFIAALAGGMAPWTPALIAGIGAAWRARAGAIAPRLARTLGLRYETVATWRKETLGFVTR